MAVEGWLAPELVVLQLEATRVEDVVKAAADKLGSVEGRDGAAIEKAFLEVIVGEGFSLGSGVVIPHTEVKADETLVCLVTTKEPLLLPTIDGRPPDIFIFILSKADPQSHLLLLAHLARLTQSRTLLEGLRRAHDPKEVVALVGAAELRHTAAVQRAKVGKDSPQVLVILSARGEQLIDALLIDLVDRGFPEANLLEAQSLREAATREVPIFAGFRDLFGDPGGRRVVLLEAPADRVEEIVGSVKRICEEHGGGDARISVVPAETWHLGAAPPVPEEPGSH
jgi:mannitol/fructose-specific phosphotransferase system IIA component (Ntr-type)